MTTNGRRVEVLGAATELFATPFRLENGRIAVDFELRVHPLNELGIVVDLAKTASLRRVPIDDDRWTLNAGDRNGGLLACT